MGFLSASASFVRYRIIDEVPKGIWPRVTDLLQEQCFQDIDQSSEERSFGWVSIDNMLDSNWSEAPVNKGEYLAFALRVDTRRIPPAVFKKHYQIALEESMAKAREQGKKFIGRDQKKELKEQVRLRLMTRTLPVPAVFDVVWNSRTNRVYFASTQAKMRSLFEDHFTQTFKLHLEPLTPFYLALDLAGKEQQNLLTEYEPAILV
ncbi:MAG: recombination-associated protein RdgC [Desulfohalobiaceae bacterium]|nr:recombination-associated protein RdgC [Desulfohalobiaceae bacterium]